jgi:MFS family permease
MAAIITRELAHWRLLGPSARLYLLHIALLTAGLAAPQLFFSLAVLALGYGREFLGLLNTLTFGAAALFSVPLWLGVNRVGLRRSLLLSAVLQGLSALLFAAWPLPLPLVLSAALAGMASALFQVTAAPFMMRHSTDATRAHLFSASSAVAIGVSGAVTLLVGPLPGWLGLLVGAGPQSAVAYRACYLVASALLLLAAVPLLFVARERAERPAEPPPRPQATPRRRVTLLERLPPALRELLRSPGPLARLLVPPVLISFGAALLIPYLNLFYRERFGVSNTTLGLIFAAFDLATGAALLAGPALARRFGAMPTVVLTRALALPLTLLMGFAPELGVSAAAALGRVALFNMAAPLYDTVAMERTDAAARPFVIGMLGGAYSAGYLVGPAL